jgi:L-serine/L-threonine ammonia-lyase
MTEYTPLHINTPLIESLPLSSVIKQITNNQKCKVLLKMDTLQPSGSFKIRGIGHKCYKEIVERKKSKLISSSGGNAGDQLQKF